MGKYFDCTVLFDSTKPIIAPEKKRYGDVRKYADSAKK